MKTLFLTFVIIIPLLMHAQSDGIEFSNNLTWQQIKNKAKKENKYIFVDCYATWCGPCREMETEVFAKSNVGKEVNNKFVSIRLQFDTSKSDNEYVKSYYAIAKKIMDDFNVSVFPTYLFFSPSGKIVHRSSGKKSIAEFVDLTQKASDFNSQYYSLIDNYRKGERRYSVMPYLAGISKELNANQLSDSLAGDYIDGYILRLSDSLVLTRENIKFIVSYYKLMSSSKRSFRLIHKNLALVDSIIGERGYSNRVVDYIIYKEKITPVLSKAKEVKIVPNWNKLNSDISAEYGVDYAERTIRNSKPGYYLHEKDWDNYAKAIVNQIDNMEVKKGVFGIITLNNSAFEIFKYSNDTVELKQAVKWVNRAAEMDTNLYSFLIDTKANLLYKLGDKEQAIRLEERAFALSPTDNEIRGILEKMKRNLPTWPRL